MLTTSGFYLVTKRGFLLDPSLFFSGLDFVESNNCRPIQLLTNFRVAVFVFFFIIHLNATLDDRNNVFEVDLSYVGLSKELNATELVPQL